MKKGLTLLLTLVLAAGLMGCGSTSGEDSRLTMARRALPDEPELTMARLALVAATQRVLKHALSILGVDAPEKM